MNRAQIGVLILALLAAALAAFLVRGLVSSNKTTPPQVVQAPETQVLVVASDVDVGKIISDTDLRWQPWPAAAVNPAYITQQQNPNAIQQYVNRIARTSMAAGEPVTADKLIDTNNAGFLAALIKPGMRAVSLTIAPETDAGGFILPGDHVDVILTAKADNNGTSHGEFTAHGDTILHNIRVLAIDQTFKSGGSQVAVGKTATLELTPGQAEILSQAQMQGILALSLRSLSDATSTDDGTDEARRAAEGSVVKIVRGDSENFVRVK